MAISIRWTSREAPAARAPQLGPAQTAFRMLQIKSLHVALWLHTEQDPSDAEWSAGCGAFLDLRQRCGGNLAALRALVISDGGAPNARQRAQFFRPALGGLHRASVITVSLSNPIKRGIATAISWMNPRFRAFEPERWSEGFAHVGLSEHADVVWREFAQLQQQLPANQTLKLVAEDAQRRSARARYLALGQRISARERASRSAEP